MKVTHDLLACQKCIVTDVVDRDLHADWCPDSVGIPQFASHAPALGLETGDRFAEQRLLGRFDDPGTIAIVGYAEILITFVVGNRTSNSLGARVASDDANALAIRLSNWFNGPRIIELKEVAIGCTSRKTRASRDTTARNFHKERGIGWFSNANNSPLDARLIWITSPQDLSRSVWLRLKSRSSRVGDIGILMPSLLDIHTGSDDAGEYHSTDFVLGDRLDGHTEPTRVFVGYWANRLDRCIAYKASECCIVDVRIA